MRFSETPHDVLRVIEIDAPLSAGGPDATWRTLFELHTQIVSAELRVVGDRLLQTLHLAELDGGAIDEARGQKIMSSLWNTFGRGQPCVAKCTVSAPQR